MYLGLSTSDVGWLGSDSQSPRVNAQALLTGPCAEESHKTKAAVETWQMQTNGTDHVDFIIAQERGTPADNFISISARLFFIPEVSNNLHQAKFSGRPSELSY